MSENLATALINAIIDDLDLFAQYIGAGIQGAQVQFAIGSMKTDMRFALEALSEQDAIKMIAALDTLRQHE